MLNVGSGHFPAVVLLEVGLHRAHVELRILVAELAGKPGGGPAHDPPLVLERAVDAPAAGALIDVALDLDLPVRTLVHLRIAPARGQLDVADPNRTAVGVEALDRLLGNATTDRLGRLLDRSFHLQQTPAEPHRHLNRHFLSRSLDHCRHNPTFSLHYRRLHDTPRRNIMSRPHPPRSHFYVEASGIRGSTRSHRLGFARLAYSSDVRHLARDRSKETRARIKNNEAWLSQRRPRKALRRSRNPHIAMRYLLFASGRNVSRASAL